MQFLLILLLSISSAVVYGILHDQITARICVEYFTIGHPPVFSTSDPSLLALGWGVISTWWAGAILGIPLALAARVGGLPKRSDGSLVRPIVILLASMGLCALVAGILGYFAAKSHRIELFEPLASRLPREKHIAFLTDVVAHIASYASGFIGGLLLIIWVLIMRYRAGVVERLAQRSVLRATP